MNVLSTLIFSFFLIYALASCNASKDCSSQLQIAFDSLVESQAKFPFPTYKEKYKSGKHKLFNKTCSLAKNQDEVVLIEFGQKHNTKVNGLIYFFNANSFFTYEQELDIIKINRGNAYDKYGTLEVFLSKIINSPVLLLDSMQSERSSNFDDGGTMRVYYFNFRKKLFKKW